MSELKLKRLLYTILIISLFTSCNDITDIEESSQDKVPNGMVLIPAKDSTFIMGASEGSWGSGKQLWWGNRTQVVSFTYNFHMDTVEVTNKMFDDLIYDTLFGYPDYTPDQFRLFEDSLPVHSINWYEAVLFCNARSKSEGLDTVYKYSEIKTINVFHSYLKDLEADYTVFGYRLPTEAEWEYAARAGVKTDFYWGRNFYPYPQSSVDSNEICKYAVWSLNADSMPSKFVDGYSSIPKKVASLQPNDWGLYDMAGNVSEWCTDYCAYYDSIALIDPIIDSGTHHPIRGGSKTANRAVSLCTSNRGGETADTYWSDLGFRCVLPVK